MKDFEQLTDEEQQDVIMRIGAKLDKQETWYWMGVVHLLREQDRRIKRAIEYIRKSSLGCDLDESETFFIKDDLLDILEGNDV